MRHIKKFNENKEVYNLKYALDKIVEKFPESDVAEMVDMEIVNYVESDWSDYYETEYDWYQDHGNGEAEDVVIYNIIGWFKNTYNVELTQEQSSELYDSIKEIYYFL
jgi:hypothetical protein